MLNFVLDYSNYVEIPINVILDYVFDLDPL